MLLAIGAEPSSTFGALASRAQIRDASAHDADTSAESNALRRSLNFAALPHSVSRWQGRAPRASWLAPAASLVLPGAGQAILRQQRSLAYVVAEAFLVIQAMRANTDFKDARLRYQTIAADVARRQFGTDRPAGPWEYYESVADSRWTSSGDYDLQLGGRFTPEIDETTFNGSQWLLARTLYWANPGTAPAESSPEYQRAVAYYREHAVQGSYRWTWRDNQNARAEYIQSINDANRSKQDRVSMVGIIAANHLLSLVDAYVTVRIRRYGGAGLVGANIRTELRPTAVPGQSVLASAVNFSLPIPGSGHRP
ncbi:MAG: hypothetical protein ACO1Q7_05030 [Gemmatimonas sp.]